MAVYTVPQQYAGKNLSQIRNETNAAFRPDVLASQLGIGENQPLTAGQTFVLDWNDPGSGEYQALQKYFNPTSDASYYQSQATAAQNAAIAPAVTSLQQQIPEIQAAGKQQQEFLQQQEPLLKQRYDNLIAQITGVEQRSENQVGLMSSREFGKRGVPLSSGIYDQYLMSQLGPLRQLLQENLANVGLGRESDLLQLYQTIAAVPTKTTEQLRAVYNAIASLQAGAGKDAITNAMNAYQFQEQLDKDYAQMANNLKIAGLENITKQAGNIITFTYNGEPWSYNPNTGESQRLIGR